MFGLLQPGQIRIALGGRKILQERFRLHAGGCPDGCKQAHFHHPARPGCGKTWILLAHPKAISEFTEDPKNPVIYKKGIFSAFVPERIEYVVKGTESPDELENMAKRGITLVNVIRDKDAQLELTAVDRAEE